MKNDLVNCCTAGDVVTVVGLVKVIDAEVGGGGRSYKSGKQGNCLFLLYLDAVSIVNHNVRAKEDENGEKPERRKSLMDGAAVPNMVDFTMRDLKFVLEFTSRFQGDQFRSVFKRNGRILDQIYSQASTSSLHADSNFSGVYDSFMHEIVFFIYSLWWSSTYYQKSFMPS